MTYDFFAMLAATADPREVHPDTATIPDAKGRAAFRKKWTLYARGPLAKTNLTKINARGETQNVGKVRDLAKGLAARNSIVAFPGATEFPYVSPGQLVKEFGNAVYIHLSWRLTAPFFSRDENAFDVFDNPLSRDRLTGTPNLKSSGAKGMMRMERPIREDSTELWRHLFGNEREQEQAFGGEVIFGDVSFDRTGSDMFSPHDRQFGVVEHPVHFEVVPAVSNASWGFLLYQRQPGAFDMIEALYLLLETGAFLIETLGMSAKRSVGYGVGEDVKCVIHTTAKLDLGETGKKRIIHKAFDEPEPTRPTAPQGKPKYYDALVVKGELCKEGDALTKLVDEECRSRGLTKQKQRPKIEKGFELRGEWRAIYQACTAYSTANTEESRKNAMEVEENHRQWQQKKQAWESDPANVAIHWEYDDLSVALKALQRSREVAS